MVGKKEEKTVYEVAVTSVGQMTVPKKVREELGIFDRATIKKVKGGYLIQKEKTAREIAQEIWDSYTPEERRRIKENAGKTARELREEIMESDEWLEEVEERYGA